ncbi:MAG: alpha-glucan family phosphorylase [Simkaniaceae bacterium]|nr:alpha-glucan family phosphorylase [Simkaniaceae bacterium]
MNELYALALDLRRSSSADAHELWNCIDSPLWNTTRNPWMILQTLSANRIEALKKDPSFQKLLKTHREKRDQALKASKWYKGKTTIAYFSMEYGLSEALPLYSGGLGILAGDHVKACSDLGVPLTAIGLLYQQGYFRQEIGPDNKQIALYPYNEPGQLPLEKLPHRISLKFPGRTVHLRVFKAIIGHISLYLLDSNDLLNDPTDRGITSELYGGGTSTRLKQEMLLGIGGVRLLQTLGIAADVYHLNEGHAAFATLERARLRQGSFQEAFEKGKQKTLFTTHTPVEAGFDRFPLDMMKTGLAEYVQELGISMEKFLSLGQLEKRDPFNMAYLAVRGSVAVNGVSQLHGKVSQKLFEKLGCKVGAITNGVHIPSWESPEADNLWRHCSGEHRWYGILETLEKACKKISHEKLWTFRLESRKRLIDYAKHCLEIELPKRGQSLPKPFLDPHVLTIGFARRFATYKRVDLLLHDEARLVKLLQDKKIQIIVAGKAHPADASGRALIEKWISFTTRPEVAPYAAFLSDYDIQLAERLVQGMDLWVNTPKRPWEASGTSGMKVLVNGGLNFSSLDGWWAEAYTPAVGWAMQGEDDREDATTLLDTLEKEIIPLFYQRDAEGIPHQWLNKVKTSMARLTPKYSTNRMVRDYVEQYYLELGNG